MATVSWSQRWPYAVSGVLAAVAGMAAGHLVAAFVNPAASPVLAVGSTVIDATPTPVKEWAVQHFGTADKPVLLSSVGLVTVLAAAGIGLVARRRPTLSLVLLVLLAGLAGAAAITRPASLPQDVAPSLVTAVVGATTLMGLRRLIEGPTPLPEHWGRVSAAQKTETDTPAAGAAASSAAAWPAPASSATASPAIASPATASPATASPATASPATASPPPESPLDHTAYAAGSPGTPPRRSFLIGAASVTAGAVVVGALGQKLSVSPTLPSSVTLPTPQTTLPPLPAGIERQIKGVSPFVTPTNDFYRVDTALVIPRVDVANWSLEIKGDVEQPFSLSFKELLAMPMIEKDITLNCVSNEVGGPYISSTRWLGVRVRDLLERAKVKSSADQILSESTDGMTISTPVEALMDDRDALVAVAMDGQPLPAKHGFPARLVTPGLYGYVGATKWLASLTATTYAAQAAYWTQRGWAEKANVKTQSRIDTPMGLATYRPGRVAVGGVAWAQGRGIKSVDVRVDGGPWEPAVLGPNGGTDYWRQWYYLWDAKPGRHELTARATDNTGTPQTAQQADPYPSGASGYHSIVVVISS